MSEKWERQYKNSATPKDIVILLEKLQTGRTLSPSSRETLLKLMTDTSTGMRRIKGLLPKEAKVAHKTGTSSTRNGLTAAANDVAIITLPDERHLVVDIFVMDSTSNLGARESMIAKISLALWKQDTDKQVY